MRDLMGLFRATTSPQTTTEHKNWRKLLEWKLRIAARDQLQNRPLVADGEPVEVFILAVQELPKGDHRKTKVVPRRWDTRKTSGDFDNIAKPVCDAANGILWHDDSQIVRAIVEEVVGAQGERARLEIFARPVVGSPFDTIFSRMATGSTSVSVPIEHHHGAPLWLQTSTSSPAESPPKARP